VGGADPPGQIPSKGEAKLVTIPVHEKRFRVASARPVTDYTRYWVVPIARAAVAFAAAMLIALTTHHHAQFGLVVFGTFAVLEGLIVGVVTWFTLTDKVVRSYFMAQGALGVVAGILALSLSSSGLGLFLYLVSVWALLTGAIELYCGVRTRKTGPASRDWMTMGGMTIILSIVFVLIPSDETLSIGIYGAYAAILGVYLGIGAFSLKWGMQHGKADAPNLESKNS
jgi:uncharacterized membrane protein HdeD (DUF308 family)